VYDIDRDGKLNSKEVMSAFNRFNGYISRQIQDTLGEKFSVSMLKAIYVFLIKEKKLPETKWDFAKLQWYRYWFFNDDPDEFKSLLPPPPTPKDLSASEASAAGVKNLPEVTANRFAILKVLNVLAETSRTKNSCEK
ncbi:MAG: hypothetical protein KDD38_10290, partial [Bdellovibrionales bacterium]|nr:hypothetical protein [Bdellovibrionales bacterium]